MQGQQLAPIYIAVLELFYDRKVSRAIIGIKWIRRSTAVCDLDCAIPAGCGIVSDLSSNAAKSLWMALERNHDWIKTYVLPPEDRDRDIQSYIRWIYDRLKDHIPASAGAEDLDRLIRKEVRSLFERIGWNGARKARFGEVGDLEDPSALGFEREVELADEVRACLKCIQKESRDLILEAFTLTEADLSRKGIRNELAARLGINRNTLDQRISRALGRIRERMRRLGIE